MVVTLSQQEIMIETLEAQLEQIKQERAAEKERQWHEVTPPGGKVANQYMVVKLNCFVRGAHG